MKYQTAGILVLVALLLVYFIQRPKKRSINKLVEIHEIQKEVPSLNAVPVQAETSAEDKVSDSNSKAEVTNVKLQVKIAKPAETPLAETNYDEKYLDAFEIFLNGLENERMSQSVFDEFIRLHLEYDPDFSSLAYMDRDMTKQQRDHFYSLLFQSGVVSDQSKKLAAETYLISLTPKGFDENPESLDNQKAQVRSLILYYASLKPDRDDFESSVNNCLESYNDPLFTSVLAMDLRDNGWNDLVKISDTTNQ